MLKRLPLAALFLVSCVSTKTVYYEGGQAYPTTTEVTIYAAASEIPFEYVLIGQLIGDGGLFGSEQKLLEKMIVNAKKAGADGIISPRFSKDAELVVWPDSQVQSYTINRSNTEMIRFKRDDQGQPIPRFR